MDFYRENIKECNGKLIKENELIVIDDEHIKNLLIDICKNKINTQQVIIMLYLLKFRLDDEYKLMVYVNTSQKQYNNDINLFKFYLALQNVDGGTTDELDEYAYNELRNLYELKYQNRNTLLNPSVKTITV